MILRFPKKQLAQDSGAGANTNAGIGKGMDADAFSAAVLAALPRLRRYAIALLRDMSMADDLVQDCIERALKNRASLADPTICRAG